jgi:predicted phage tail component-like protein
MVDSAYFVFKGTNSLDLDIAIDDPWMPPEEMPEEEVEYIEIPGRDGYLTVNKGRKKPITKMLRGALFDERYQSAIEKWLEGEGSLILSTEPDCYYNARIVGNVKYYYNFEGVKSFTVNFICQPYKYLLSSNNPITLTTPMTFINPGSESYPLITVYGSGLVDLEVNSQMLHLDIDGHITLDSELMESYKDNALETFTGEFPILIEGLNSITWTGTVTEVEVIPRWRK